MTKHLSNTRAANTPRLPRRTPDLIRGEAGIPRRAKGLPRRRRTAKAGWSPERRARQAALIRNWAPWRRSTGPRTDEGKAVSSLNATRHGRGSRAFIARLRRIRHALRLAAQTLAVVRAHLRLRDASRRRERDLKILRAFAHPDLDCGPAFTRGLGHTPPLCRDDRGSVP